MARSPNTDPRIPNETAAAPADPQPIKPGPVPSAFGETRRAATPARETIRIECLKIAMERVTTTKPPGTIIAEARAFEAYVAGSSDEKEDQT